MNLTWKDLFILGLGSIVILLAGFKLIDLMYLKNKDIEVAVVGFIGTIIGGTLSGAITLIGVKSTIEHNQSIENKRRLKEELMFLYPLQREIEEILDNNWIKYNESHIIYHDILIYVRERLSVKSELYDYAQRGSLEVYSELIRIKEFYDSLAMQILESGYIEGVTNIKAFELIQDKLTDFQKLIRKEISLKKSELTL